MKDSHRDSALLLISFYKSYFLLVSPQPLYYYRFLSIRLIGSLLDRSRVQTVRVGDDNLVCSALVGALSSVLSIEHLVNSLLPRVIPGYHALRRGSNDATSIFISK